MCFMRRCCLEAPRKEPSRGVRGVRVECIRHLHRSSCPHQRQGTPTPGRPSVLGHGCPCGHSWLSLCTGKARCQGQPSQKETQVLLQGRIHRNLHTYGHPPPHPAQASSSVRPLAQQRPQAYYGYRGCCRAPASVEPRLLRRRAEFPPLSCVKLAAAPSSEASRTKATVIQARACCANRCGGGPAREEGEPLRPLPAPLPLPHWPPCSPEGPASHLVPAPMPPGPSSRRPSSAGSRSLPPGRVGGGWLGDLL